MPDSTPSRSALHLTCDKLIRPRLTSRSGSAPSPFQAQGEISPGKNALLHCTTAGSTPPPFGHKSFTELCPLALFGNAFYPVLVHRPTASIHAASPHPVARMQLRFTSLTVTSLWRDLHPQECAHAGRTQRNATLNRVAFLASGLSCNPARDGIHGRRNGAKGRTRRSVRGHVDAERNASDACFDGADGRSAW